MSSTPNRRPARFQTGSTNSERVELAQLCQRAESEFVGMPCGILDPFAIACGERGAATLLRCADLESRSLPLAHEIAVFDTGARRELRAGRYAERTRECEAGLRAARELVARGLPDLSALRPDDLPRLEAGLEPTLFRRVRHVVTENARVFDFARALEQGDDDALGRAMYGSHRSLRDDFEASWPEADFLVERASDTRGVIGARMTGAGWGGCTVQLLRDAELEPLLEAFRAEFGRELGVWRAGRSAGARLLSPAPAEPSPG